MLQIKAFVDLQPYDEIAAFVGVEAERVVRSYVVTSEGGALAAQIIENLVAPRATATALQVISGKRGVGKSHLLSFLRAIIGVKALRTAAKDARLTSALRQLADQPLVAVELNLTSEEKWPFELALRAAISEVLGQANDFNDERWEKAVAQETLFEQLLGLLPLETRLVLVIDNLSDRWRHAPELMADDLQWLALIARQAKKLPLRAILTLDEESLTPESGSNNQQVSELAELIARSGRIYYLSLENLHEVVTQHLLRKTPKQLGELAALYRELKEKFPHFAWLEDEFLAYYPVHPAIYRLTPLLRAYSQSFSLPGFIAAAVARAAGRPALSLVMLDEVFDRYEYELRKNRSLEASFILYDQLAARAVPGLAMADRLWARLLLKALFLFSLTTNPVSARLLTEAQLLCEEDETQPQYERVAHILIHFEQVCPEAIYAEGEGLDRAYLIAAARRAPSLEEELAMAACNIATSDPRLAELMVTVGGGVFSDWRFDSDLDPGTQELHLAYEILWRGTIRRGSVRFGTAEDAEVGLVSGLPLRTDSEDDLLGLSGEESPDSQRLKVDEDWRLVIVPFNYDLDLEAPCVSTVALRWRAGLLAAEASLRPLKMLLALRSGLAGQARSAAEIEHITSELKKEVRKLFRELYLERGNLLDHRGALPIRPQWQRLQTFAQFLELLLDDTLSSCFPDHPRFKAILSEAQVEPLVLGLFAAASNDDLTRKLAANFAVPMGLATESGGVYRMTIYSDAVLAQPFIQRIFALLDKQAEGASPASVPLREVELVLSAPPWGLQPAAQHLILGALIAGGLIELVNETTGDRLLGATLHLGYDPSRYTALRRVPPMDYTIEVLTEWCNQLTEQQTLPAPVTTEAKRRVREALAQWLAAWRAADLRLRFERLPIDSLTLNPWQAVAASLRRYERTASVIEAVLKETTTLETGLSRIIDIFGADLEAFRAARAQLKQLGEFLDWVPQLQRIRDYLLAAEVTGEKEIDQIRQGLLRRLGDTRQLLQAGARSDLEATFEHFRKRYSEFYLAAHESSVGQLAYRELVESFYRRLEWTNFKVLVRLKVGGRAFERDAQALVKLIGETHCQLPVAELLQTQPHCCCSFRLKRRLHLGSLLDALKAVVSAATNYYCNLLLQRRDELSQKLRSRGESAAALAIDHFIAACSNGQLDALKPEIATLLNELLPEPTIATIVPSFPNLSQGYYTKEELRERIREWLESLPDQDGLHFGLG